MFPSEFQDQTVLICVDLDAMLHEQLPRPRQIMGPREHAWERERIRLELEELIENVRRTFDESGALLSEVERALNRSAPCRFVRVRGCRNGRFA
jgi:hypothetical protein